MLAKSKKLKRGTYQTVIFSTLLGILTLGVIGFLIISAWKINQRRAELTARIEDLKKEIQILEEKNAKLRAGILETTKESYWEGRAAEQGYVREGTQQVVVLPPEKSQEAEVTEQKNLWQKILEKFGF